MIFVSAKGSGKVPEPQERPIIMSSSIAWRPEMGRLPSIFVSHGAPSFALEPGVAGPALTALGQSLPTPKAVLVVSAHWMTPQPRVAVTASPETIHDFGGFDPALYRLNYPAPGAPEVAQRALEALRDAGWDAQPDTQWGFDHGTWVPLMHLFPDASVPVFQVSMPRTTQGDSAYALGQALAPLADEGVLIVGSGSLTHNLYEVQWDGGGEPVAYAREFSEWIRTAVTGRQHQALRRTMHEAPHAHRAHPTAEHLWPLMVAAGAAGDEPPGTVVDGGFTHGVLSMDSFVFGTVPALLTEPAGQAVPA
ncbi:class III extradiol ring-cleavage dioxygenase [Hydrogenophaga sp. 5NK40-0174]|uniref:dioxygenase family protein n=1 Tax=Hydrogenophaga sp. 5NK40-0174 TaxID=3127649 RepID=UPI00310407DB